MKIIIAGGRDVSDYEIVRQAMIESGYWKQWKREIEVVSGTARGADRLGEEFAERNGLLVHRFPADWDTHGKAAGHIRNRDMGDFAKEHEGRLLALWDGVSPGTKGMIQYARQIGLQGFIYRVDKPARYVKVGTKVWTDYSGKLTRHTIVARERDEGWQSSQSGVRFQLRPAVPKSGGELSWIDADWFRVEDEEGVVA